MVAHVLCRAGPVVRNPAGGEPGGIDDPDAPEEPGTGGE
jgi:hypothetical protein